ncbi:MAG: thioredoxin-dependent peroxiredoxin [Frankiales bacterium]|nr:thioredoxin-dependent peroxiredoxin [Frankiales bacterium]
MTLKAGDKAPDFTLPDETGAERTLSSYLATGPVVLFFYPAANTAGCTAEACHFRDLATEFEAAGAQRLGISVDDVDKQNDFSTKHGFDYPLLADVGGAVATSYGVKRGALMRRLTPVKRATFVIGADGVISDVITSETRMDRHADEALKALAR